MRKIIPFLSFVFILLILPQAHAAKILKIKGSKAIVKLRGENFSRRNKVYIYDEDGEIVGKGRVIKVKTRSMLIKKISGTMDIGYSVSRKKKGGYMENSKSKSIRGYVGFAKAEGAQDTPFPLGADFLFKASWMDWMKDFDILAGFLMWNIAGTGYKVDVKEFGLGVEKKYPIKKFAITYGARFGFSLYESTTSVFLFGTTVQSSTEIFVAPHAGVEFDLNKSLSLGGEVRIPFYMTGDAYSFFDLVYVLGALRYKF